MNPNESELICDEYYRDKNGEQCGTYLGHVTEYPAP